MEELLSETIKNLEATKERLKECKNELEELEIGLMEERWTDQEEVMRKSRSDQLKENKVSLEAEILKLLNFIATLSSDDEGNEQIHIKYFIHAFHERFNFIHFIINNFSKKKLLVMKEREIWIL